MNAIDLAAIDEALVEIRAENAARELKRPQSEEQMRANVFAARLMEELRGRYDLSSSEMRAMLDCFEASPYHERLDIFKLCCKVLRDLFPNSSKIDEKEEGEVDRERIHRITNHVFALVEMVFPIDDELAF